MENIIIRNVKYEDIESVVDIQINGWKEAYKNIIDEEYLETMDRESKIKKRREDYNKNGFIVAQYDNQVVGFCRYVDNNSHTSEIEDVDCELLALYVKPELKGMGIGGKMFNYVKEEFKRKNKKKMILWCLKDNYKSRKFYEKMGGELFLQKEIEIGQKKYYEVSFIYDL